MWNQYWEIRRKLKILAYYDIGHGERSGQDLEASFKQTQIVGRGIEILKLSSRSHC